MRFAASTLVGALVLVVSLVGGSDRVGANTGGGPCLRGLNASSTSCVNNASGDTYVGGYGAWHNNNMYLTLAKYNQGYHINN